jgi:putative transcriptional regulator
MSILEPAVFFTVAPQAIGMADVLENKRTATRFRILVEIADRQPAVSQGEIADAVGVTSQAVSEYIRELVDDDFVEKEGRSRYRVTKEGVDWLLQEATDVRRFAEHVTDDILGTVQEDAAIATDSIAEGDRVSLSLVDGLLHATPGESGPATGVATTDAEAGQDVGVTGFEGVIDLDPGTVTVLQIPPVRAGGSDAADLEQLEAPCADLPVVVAAGVEAVVALQTAEIEPVTHFSPGEVAADAAGRGLDVAVVTTTDDVGRVTDVLRDTDVSYEVSTVE